MRNYNTALWCVKKHLMLSDVHLGETLQKLARECDGTCSISDATRIETEGIVKNLAAAEEHIVNEIVPQLEDDKLKYSLLKSADRIRELRQDIAQTGLPFRYSTEVLPEAMITVTKAQNFLNSIINDIDKHAVLMEQELYCPKCEEDIKRILNLYADNNNRKIDIDKKNKIGDKMEMKELGEMALGGLGGAAISQYAGPALDGMLTPAATTTFGKASTYMNILGGVALGAGALYVKNDDAQAILAGMSVVMLSNLVKYAGEMIAPPAAGLRFPAQAVTRPVVVTPRAAIPVNVTGVPTAPTKYI
jgi:hypothetical protein